MGPTHGSHSGAHAARSRSARLRADLPAPSGEPPELRAHAVSFIESVLDGLGLERPAFIANSLGSLWALWLASDRPRRVGAMAHVGCPCSHPGLRRRSRCGCSRRDPRRDAHAASAAFPQASGASLEGGSSVSASLLQVAQAILATERMPGFERTFRSNLRALLRLREQERGARSPSPSFPPSSSPRYWSSRTEIRWAPHGRGGGWRRLSLTPNSTLERAVTALGWTTQSESPSGSTDSWSELLQGRPQPRLNFIPLRGFEPRFLA